MNKRAKVGVNRDEDPVFGSCPLEQGRIPWIGSPKARFGDIMARSLEPLCQAAPGASIDQEVHAGAIRTASSWSSAITAWA